MSLIALLDRAKTFKNYTKMLFYRKLRKLLFCILLVNGYYIYLISVLPGYFTDL